MPLRQVVESSTFKHDLEMYEMNYPNLAQVYEAVKEDILNQPSIGKPLKMPRDFRILTTEPIADIDGEPQGFYVVYKYDLNHIYMEEIGKVDFFN